MLKQFQWSTLKEGSILRLKQCRSAVKAAYENITTFLYFKTSYNKTNVPLFSFTNFK